MCLHERLDLGAVNAILDELVAAAGAALLREGFGTAEHRFERVADLRYYGQAFEVRVAVPDGPLDGAAADRVAEEFHRAHRVLYGYDFAGESGQRVEWVNLRVSGVGPINRPEIARQPLGDPAPPSPRSTRPVCFERSAGYRDVPVYWRPDLRPGVELSGPAVIEEFGATVPLHPGFAATVDGYRNLVIRRAGGAR